MDSNTQSSSDEIEANKYFMGIDAGGDDQRAFAMCIAKSNGAVECVMRTLDEGVFKKEIDRLAEYYNIPNERIFYEINK